MDNISEIINNFPKKKVLVIGDIMADKYLWGEVERVSPEAPVQVVKINKETHYPGGAANLASNIVDMGGQAFLVGSIGNDSAAIELSLILKHKKIDASGVVVDEKKPTITKVRVIGQNQQLIRLDYEKVELINNSVEEKLINNIKQYIEQVDIIGISDYAKGTLTPALVSIIINLAKKHKKQILVDTKSTKYELYKGVDLITPNFREASKMTGIKGQDEKDIAAMGKKLSTELGSNVLITRASEGMSLFTTDGKAIHVPTEAKEVFDVSGAGDTVVAALALALACGASFENAVLLSNQAAAIQVSKLATATVSKKELLRRFELESAKIMTLDKTVEIAKENKANNKKIVFTNGCFDLLHPGHIKYLRKASDLGDILIVALNTDDSVRRIKGAGRPVINQEQRAEMISVLDFVDIVTFFNEDTPEDIISKVKPDIFVKGGDYKISELPEAKVVKSYGAEVIIIPFIKGFSSSKIINKIKDTYLTDKA